MSIMNRLPITPSSEAVYITARGEAGREPYEQCASTLSNTALFTRTTLSIDGQKKVLWRTTGKGLVSFLKILEADYLTSFEFYLIDQQHDLVRIPLEELVSLKYGESPAE